MQISKTTSQHNQWSCAPSATQKQLTVSDCVSCFWFWK